MSQRWVKPRPAYYVQTGGMHQNPYGVPPDEIARFAIDNPPEIVAQVVFGKYVESSGLVFTSEVVRKLWDRQMPVVRGNFWMDADIARAARDYLRYDDGGPRFHIGVDFARQTDWTVITVIDTLEMPARVVYFKRLNRVPWETIYTEVGKARAMFGPNILCDSTGMGGDVVMDALESRCFCTVHQQTVMVGAYCLDPVTHEKLDCDREKYLPLSVCEGFGFTGTTKKQLVEHLRNVMAVGYNGLRPDQEYGWLRAPFISQLNEELSFYSWDDKGLETDCLFSLALASWSGLEEVQGDPVYGSVYGD